MTSQKHKNIFVSKGVQVVFALLVSALFVPAFAQQGSTRVTIGWKSIPDSVTFTSVLFDGSGLDETFPVHCYFKEIATVGNALGSVKCVGELYDVNTDFVSDAERIFLSRFSNRFKDTLYYEFV
ncbi:MAG: hypothetical protein J6W45_09995, partial [Bacteroidales bacterium]|nr:hypothetical protein [Bacteroidales bacterium]